MKLLINKEELKNYKSRDLILCECEYCRQPYKVEKNEIQSVLMGTRIRKHCSKICQSKAQIKKQIVKCDWCNKQFLKQPSQIRAKHNFCSQSCSTSYNNTHKTHGTRISKLEVWLKEELIKLFPILDIKFNDKSAIKSELDIYIPSLNLAFEINGIYHYKPIHGIEKLKRTQIMDEQKINNCLKQKIELHILDVHNMEKFNKKEANIFLEIIKNFIKSKEILNAK